LGRYFVRQKFDYIFKQHFVQNVLGQCNDEHKKDGPRPQSWSVVQYTYLKKDIYFPLANLVHYDNKYFDQNLSTMTLILNKNLSATIYKKLSM